MKTQLQTAFLLLILSVMGASAQKINPSTGLRESTPDQATNVATVLQQADDLMARGQYEESLQLRRWYYDHALESGDSYQQLLRRSSSFFNWVELGRRYPPARKALLEIRDNDTQKISSGNGYFDLFEELYNINNFLQQDDATVKLFKSIEQSDPQLAEQCFIIVQPLLAQKGDYETCRKYIGDPQASFESMSNRFQMDMLHQARMKALDADTDKRLAEMMKQRGLTNMPARSLSNNDAMMEKNTKDQFVGGVRQLIEILVATGDKADAVKIQHEAIGVLDDTRLEMAVADADEKIIKQINISGAGQTKSN